MWSELANSYLEHAQVGEAIAAYLRAADTSKYNEVIAKANEVGGPRQPAARLAEACGCGCVRCCAACRWCADRGTGQPAAHSSARGWTVMAWMWQAAGRYRTCRSLPNPPSSLSFLSPGWAARRPGQVPADGSQEGQGPQGAREGGLLWGGAGKGKDRCRACLSGCDGWTVLLPLLLAFKDAARERLRRLGLLASTWAPPHQRSAAQTDTNPLRPPHPQVDTELVYAYAKNKDLGPLEEFITGSHLANLQAVGDRCGVLGGAAWALACGRALG